MSIIKEPQIKETPSCLNSSNPSSIWKSVTVRLKENDLALLNNKLKVNGFGTFSEFIHAWLKGEYPRHENNEQVDKLLNRLRANDIKDPLTREFNPTFYRNVDPGFAVPCSYGRILFVT